MRILDHPINRKINEIFERLKLSFLLQFRKKNKQLAEYILLIIILFIPFYDYLQNFGNYYLSLTPIILLPVLFLFNRPEKKIIKKIIPFIIFLLIAILNLKTDTAEGIFEIYVMFLLFTAGTIYGIDKRKRVLIIILAIIAVLYAIYQIEFAYKDYIELLKHMNIPNKQLILNRLQKMRAYSFFILPSLFSGFMIFAMGVTLEFKGLNRKWKYLISLLCISGIILSKSIGGILISFVLILIYFIKDSKSRIIKTIIILSLIVLSIAVIKIRKIDFTSGPFYERFYNYYSTGEIIRDYYFSGIGYGQFNNYYPRYSFKDKNNPRYAHNIYLQMICETGVLGSSLFFTFLAALCYTAIKKKKYYVVLGFLMHNFIDIGFYFIPIGGLFFYYFGTLFKNEESIHKKNKHENKMNNAVYIFMILIFLCGVSMIVEKTTLNLPFSETKPYRDILERVTVWNINSLTELKTKQEYLKYLERIPSEGLYFNVKESILKQYYLADKDYNSYGVLLKKEKRFKLFNANPKLLKK